jgi:putative hydrolase of the HAD superfamily
LVDEAELRPYFEVILSSAALGIRKPHPRIFEIALEALETQPSRAAMIGDTLGADILGANNAGMFSIWVTRRADVPANRAHSDTIKPDAVIRALGELPDLLEKLEKQ